MNVGRQYRGIWIAALLACWWTEPALPQQAVAPADQSLPVVQNNGGIRIDVLPGEKLPVGTKASFQISAKQAGYLIVVVVNAAGKVTQIYPNANYVLTAGADAFSNRMKPGQVLTIPEPGNPYTGFVFVVSPPAGVALSVAILSDQPVQFLDLPDVPASMTGRVEAFNYVADAARALQLAPVAVGARLVKPKWSFGGKFYRIE
jgi:hypothetical protein